jgi:hypothetical protein
MLCRTRWFAAGILVVVCQFCATVNLRAEEPVNTDKLGTKVANINFKDGTAKPAELYSIKDRKAYVIVFLNFDCPVSRSYADTLAQLAKTYADQGVTFLGICTNEELTTEQLSEQVKDHQLGFAVYSEKSSAAADALKAKVTPEAFVLDHNFYLRYRGRIDNSYYARLRKNANTTTHDLEDALDAVLAGKDVPRPATQAIGCSIGSQKSTKKDGKVTYYRDVQPILQTNCQSCHRPGEVGPFSLMSYKDAVSWADDIKEYTHSHKMPPWKPVEGSDFQNERKLTDAQIATLAAWVEGGLAEGDPKDAPAPRKFPDGWQLGKPDVVLTPDEDMHIGASGKDHFRCFVLPTNLTEDKFVTAVEVRPGNPRVVHHALLFVDTHGKARELEQKEKDRTKKEGEADYGPGYSVGMGSIGFLPTGALRGWAPGIMPSFTPEGTGFRLPKDSDVVLQLHYHRDGKAEKDRTQIGLYFSKEKTVKPFGGLVVVGSFLVIPAGTSEFKVTGSTTVNKDCEIHDIMPHMHMLGKKVKVTMTPPEGEATTLIAVDDWDYNWQEMYVFKEPLKVKAGTKFSVEAVYDNSNNNPNNPNDPPKWVKFGEQTTDEMCFIFMGATSDKPGPFMDRKGRKPRDDSGQ